MDEKQMREVKQLIERAKSLHEVYCAASEELNKFLCLIGRLVLEDKISVRKRHRDRYAILKSESDSAYKAFVSANEAVRAIMYPDKKIDQDFLCQMMNLDLEAKELNLSLSVPQGG